MVCGRVVYPGCRRRGVPGPGSTLLYTTLATLPSPAPPPGLRSTDEVLGVSRKDALGSGCPKRAGNPAQSGSPAQGGHTSSRDHDGKDAAGKTDSG